MRLLPGLLVALAVAAGGAAAVPAQDKPPQDKEGGKARPAERRRLVEGDEVKDLSLELVEGGSWTAAGARGKVVVLVFAGDWSPESLDGLQRLADPKGKVIAAGAGTLGILRDCGVEKARKVAKERELGGALAVDPRRRAYDLLARGGLPYTVVLDRAGKIALSKGGFDEDAVAKKVEGLLKP